MITDVPMRLDFYKQHVRSPRYFDILMNTNGTLAVINPMAMRGHKLVIVLEKGSPVTPTPQQIVSIYAMISRYGWCEVAFYGLDI
ncbi:hypothetical protein Rleg2_1118 [Rhizobium leguminosarum bv. trifolii WSM2304]|uniref:Uncharacterized protein n=2 Tax=Rhizobium leguminosarum TaxID=384 RepID=A0ABF7QKU5_RHILW|nr:hypothetical protein Rleg2_1118 [Rhizobium leguminosarum bv. trifolii WSM2304]